MFVTAEHGRVRPDQSVKSTKGTVCNTVASANTIRPAMERNLDSWSREKWSRLDDSTWHRLQHTRRWVTMGSWAWALAALLFGCVMALQGYASGQLALADAAKIRAQAAEIRRQMDMRECQQFPASCRDRRSVFFQRSKLQPEKNIWKRR